MYIIILATSPFHSSPGYQPEPEVPATPEPEANSKLPLLPLMVISEALKWCTSAPGPEVPKSGVPKDFAYVCSLFQCVPAVPPLLFTLLVLSVT